MDNTLTTEQREYIRQVFGKHKHILSKCGDSPTVINARKQLIYDSDSSVQFLAKCVKYLHDSKTIK